MCRRSVILRKKSKAGDKKIMEVSSEQEELRLLHKICREGRTIDIAKLTSTENNVLSPRYSVTGRTVGV